MEDNAISNPSHFFLVEHNTGEVEMILIEKPEVADVITAFETIRIESKFDNLKNLNVIFKLLKNTISSLATNHPNQIHHEISRKVIEELDHEVLLNTDITDKLARELTNYCNIFNKELVLPKNFTKREHTQDDLQLDSVFEKDEMFLWDYVFLKILKSIGPTGKKSASDLNKICKKEFKSFKKENKNPLEIYINLSSKPGNPLYLSPALIILTKIIYKDKIKPLSDRLNKYIPATPKQVRTNIRDFIIASKKTKININNNEDPKIYSNNNLIAKIPIATLEPTIIKQVIKGFEILHTVLGIRTYRYLAKCGFNQWASNKEQPNILWYDNGLVELCRELDIDYDKYGTKLHNILKVYAYSYFTAFKGNLITLNRLPSHNPINHRDALVISLGPVLMPNYCHQLHPGERLLIPIPPDPELCGPTQYWASQFLLQDEVMALFSNKSNELVKGNGVIITPEKFQEMAYISGIPLHKKKLIQDIRDCWSSDGKNSSKMLEKIDKNTYLLGPAYKAQIKFLISQGQLRAERSLSSKLKKM